MALTERPFAVAALVFLVLLPIYLATASYSVLQSNDPRSAAQAGYRVAMTGDLAFDERWPVDEASWAVEGRDGRYYSNRFPGVISAASLAYATVRILGGLDTEAAAHPYDVPLWPATVLAAIVAAFAVALTYLLLDRLHLPHRHVVIATGLVALGSPVWSVSADALWTHGFTHLLLVGMLLALVDDQRWIAAAAAVVVVTFRPHLIVAVAILALASGWKRGRWHLLAGGAVGLALVAGYSLWVFGRPLPAAGYDVDALVSAAPITSVRAFGVNLSYAFVDPYRGLLLYVPAAVFALVPIRRGWTEAPRWAKAAALAGASYGFTQLALIRASGGVFFFGHRTLIEALVLASPLLLTSLSRACQESVLVRRVVAGVLVVSFAVHTYGAFVGMPQFARAELERRYEQVSETRDTSP